MHLIATLLSAALLGSAGPTPPARAAYLCNAAHVHPPARGGPAVVRSGPGRRFRAVARLADGRPVYTCDERGPWYKVAFGAPRGPCGVGSPAGLDVGRAARCRSGWVRREWVEITSG